MNIFSKIAAGLKKTKDSMMGKLEALMNSFTKIDEEFFEELEELLITCDIGVETSLDICGELVDAAEFDGRDDSQEKLSGRDGAWAGVLDLSSLEEAAIL